ncbi:DUF2231 domain-containing protein [Hyphobacterium indicum]|uniref:DUF2231 domain-containing protein n=1 Tax=Hyphobacterium indicum TaxID=2162714 RepID=UPI000D644918|nr:DUF2231 domain-containing protein [Hyphobacterium indicum]
MTIRRFLSALALTLAIGLMSPNAMAHPPAEHDEAGQTSEAASDTPPNAVESHDDAGSPPHEHGDAVPYDDSDSTPHGHDASATAIDYHGPDPEARATNDHHAGDEGGAVDDHHAQGAETGGHAHWGDNGPQTDLERAIAKAGALHSVAVHFPIALVLAAALAQALGLMTGRAGYADIVRFLVWTAAFGGLAAGLLGWAHAGPIASTEDGIMSIHRWLGTSLTVGLFAVAGAAEWKHRSGQPVAVMSLTVLLFGAAAAVAINGFLGGSLAHGGLAHLMGS